MYVPTIPHEKAVDEDGTFTKPWDSYLEQQAQNMQLCLSNEGFVIPSVNASQLAIIQATYGQQTGVQLGTLVFNTSSINGGSSGAPNGQLYILLADGVFHPVTNT